MTKKILITGALGQIGSDLLLALKEKYGAENVIASDLKSAPNNKEAYPYEIVDILKKDTLKHVIKEHNINTVYHLAAILSAAGENNPQLCWDVNINGLHNVLETCRETGVKQIICPSSIAVFGPNSPRENTPQETILIPTTLYGVTKVSGELLCDYYVKKYKMDIRGIRYPGLISYKSLPGGGTTDYAVEIFYSALKKETYKCFLSSDTVLPMMYMPDAIRGTIQLSESPFENLNHYSNFNFASVSFSCEEIAQEIQKHLPEFKIEYHPDHRQAYANSWPKSIDDSSAQKEWGWKPKYNLSMIVEDMLKNLSKKIHS